MHLVTLTVPSTMSNFTTNHAAPNHDLQKMLHCQIQALRLEFFSRKPTHIMCGSSCKHDLLLLEALLAAILLAAILHFSHHSCRSSSDFNLRLAKDMQPCVVKLKVISFKTLIC